MTYPCEWIASTDPADERGTATFMVDGIKYTLRLENFVAFQNVSVMLETTFRQGKVWAAQAMRSHVERSLDNAELYHDLKPSSA